MPLQIATRLRGLILALLAPHGITASSAPRPWPDNLPLKLSLVGEAHLQDGRLRLTEARP
jgi:hypothetical protein